MNNRRKISLAVTILLAAGVLGLAACRTPSGGNASGGNAPGGNAAGENVPDGNAAGENVPDGNASGESVPDGHAADETQTKGTAEQSKNSTAQRDADEYLKEVVAAVESQYPDETFTDITPEELNLSASLFADSYSFAGKRAASGWEFVAGTCRTRENPLEGMTCGTGGGIPGYTTSQFDGGKLLILEKGDSGRSRLSYLYDVLQQGKAGIRAMEDAAKRGVSLAPPAEGPFLRVSMVKNGYPVTEFLPLDEAQRELVLNGHEVDETTEPGAPAVEFMEDRSRLSALEANSYTVTKEMVKLAEERCALTVGHSSNISDLTKAVMKVNLYGEAREETVENREDLERLAAQFTEAAVERPEFPGYYEGVITMTRQDGMTITVQMSQDNGGFVLGNASYRTMPEENAEAVWSVFSTLDGWRRYGDKIRMRMSELSYAIDSEKLTFTLTNATGKPIQYVLSPIFYKKGESRDEDGNPVWKRIDSVAGFCGFLSPMDGEELNLEVPWNGAFVAQGPGTYKLEIQVSPEADLRYEISDTFELTSETLGRESGEIG